MNKKAVIAFLGNALFDSRVMNLYSSLTEKGIKVKVLSFDFKDTKVYSDNPDIIVFPYPKRNSLLFYTKFFARLNWELSKEKFDYYFAEDVYTLPIVQFWTGLYSGKLIYDSRELYPFLAGLREKSTNQKIIAAIEKRYIYEADKILVTGKMDAEFLEEYYNVNNILLLRNLPKYTKQLKPVNIMEKLSLPENAKIIIYQGVILEGRGIKLTIDAIKNLPEWHFVILGDGEFRDEFQSYSEKICVSNRVHFLGFISQEELLNYSSAADLGMALIENLSKSYYYALPNKLFEYIMAGTPVMVSNLPQMREVVENYNVGIVAEDWTPETISKELQKISSGEIDLKKLKANCRNAAQTLNWENEFELISGELLN